MIFFRKKYIANSIVLNASRIFESENSVGLFERLPSFTFYKGSDLKNKLHNVYTSVKTRHHRIPHECC
jgi:hypothetical protein